MLDKLRDIYKRWEDIGIQLGDPAVVTDMSRYVKLSKDYRDLEKIAAAYKEYDLLLKNISSAREILNTEKDDEFREMAKLELTEMEARKIQLEEEVRLMMIPKDPEDDKNCVMEVRAGTGGDEALRAAPATASSGRRRTSWRASDRGLSTRRGPASTTAR